MENEKEKEELNLEEVQGGFIRFPQKIRIIGEHLRKATEAVKKGDISEAADEALNAIGIKK